MPDIAMLKPPITGRLRGFVGLYVGIAPTTLRLSLRVLLTGSLTGGVPLMLLHGRTGA